MANVDLLRTELADDPIPKGYSAMSDEEVAVSLNDDASGRTLPVDEFSSARIYEMVDTSEFNDLVASDKEVVERVFGLGEGIDVSPSSKARAVLLNAFGAGTSSRTAMVAAVSRAVSRAEELGIGIVRVGHVQEARR